MKYFEIELRTQDVYQLGDGLNFQRRFLQLSSSSLVAVQQSRQQLDEDAALGEDIQVSKCRRHKHKGGGNEVDAITVIRTKLGEFL